MKHAVLGTEGIGHTFGAVRVVARFSVDEKAVLMTARREGKRGPPRPLDTLFQGMGVDLPIAKGAGEMDLICLRRLQGEDHPLLAGRLRTAVVFV